MDLAVEFAVVDEQSPAAQRAITRYFDELAERFPTGFDVAAYRAGVTAAEDESFVVGTLGGQVVAGGALRRLTADVAEIKRMWVDPDTRGHGVGRRLLFQLERMAADLGHRSIRLDTNSTLIEAIRLYERAGYHPIPRYNDNPYAHVWFEKSLESPDTGRN